jgi:hypothetical protein
MRAAIVALLWMASVASAGPLALGAKTDGSTLELSFHNTSQASVQLPVRVRAEITMYDWLTVKLSRAGAPPRTFHFIESREKSYEETVAIAPGKTIVEKIDLVWWTMRADNDGPLPPGTYDLDIAWAGKEKLTATTKLTIAAPIEKSCTDAATTGLQLLARIVPTTRTLEVGVHNIDRKPHCIAAYVHAGERHFDWFTLRLGPSRTGTLRELHFDDDRTKAGIIYVELAPGATSWTTWDLAAWAKRQRNGGTALPTGALYLGAAYDASREKTVWRGKLALDLYANW